MPLSYPGRVSIAEHDACLRRRGGLRRQSPRHRCRVTGPDALDRLQAAAHHRPSGDRRRGGPSTPTCSTPTTPRCSTTSSCGGSTRSASTSCPTRRAPGAGAARSGSTTTPTSPARRAILAVQGPSAREALATVFPEAAAVAALPRRPTRLGRRAGGGGRHRLHRRGRRGDRRAGGRRAARCGSALLVAGGRTGRARRPGRAAPGGRPAVRTATSSGPASRRSRPGWAGSCGGTRATSAAGAPLEAEKERGVARKLRGIATEGPPPAPGRAARPGRRHRRRHDDQRQLQPDARPRHRPGVPAPGGRRRRRRRDRDPPRAEPARGGRQAPVRRGADSRSAQIGAPQRPPGRHRISLRLPGRWFSPVVGPGFITALAVEPTEGDAEAGEHDGLLPRSSSWTCGTSWFHPLVAAHGDLPALPRTVVARCGVGGYA